MSSKSDSQEALPSTRGDLMALLNQDLAREYQSVLSAVVYSQVLKGAAYQYVANQVRRHAADDLEHALLLAGLVDYLGGMPVATARPVRTSPHSEDVLRYSLEAKYEAIGNYRERVRQCENLGEPAIAEVLRGILVREQAHQICLGKGLGVQLPSVIPRKPPPESCRSALL